MRIVNKRLEQPLQFLPMTAYKNAVAFLNDYGYKYAHAKGLPNRFYKPGISRPIGFPNKHGRAAKRVCLVDFVEWLAYKE